MINHKALFYNQVNKAMFTFIFKSPSYSIMVLIHWQAVCGSALFCFSPLPIKPLHAKVTAYFIPWLSALYLVLGIFSLGLTYPL